jgi:hypothetical protein
VRKILTSNFKESKNLLAEILQCSEKSGEAFQGRMNLGSSLKSIDEKTINGLASSVFSTKRKC